MRYNTLKNHWDKTYAIINYTSTDSRWLLTPKFVIMILLINEIRQLNISHNASRLIQVLEKVLLNT